MGSIYGRLGFNFDTANFKGDDTLTPGVENFLKNSSIDLSTWQIDDIANTVVGGYYENPYNDNLGELAVFITGINTYANTEAYGYNNSDLANTMYSISGSAQTTLTNFTNHTNNLSGVTESSNTAAFPDLNSGLNVGRQILQIVNKSDGVQNNVPILGNFTSLYVANTIAEYANTIRNDYITLDNSFIDSSNSNISNSQMNVIIGHMQSFVDQIDSRVSDDISFYTNSYEILNEYSYVLQFSNTGATQNSLLEIVGTDKLKDDLGLTP
jgi:hypothetical protein